MISSCCGVRKGSSFKKLDSESSSMDQLAIQLRDGQPGFIRCDAETVALVKKDVVLLSTPIQKLLNLVLSRQPATSTDQGSHDNHKRSNTIPLKISALVKVGNENKLKEYDLFVPTEKREEAEQWIDMVLARAYNGVKQSRRVRLLINPVGGKGKARHLVNTLALPVFAAAGCPVEVIETEYAQHAEDFAKTMPLNCDVLAAASGDGIVHELLNGLAVREDADQAMKIPVVPIPTGSANGMSINLLGLEEGFDVALASLNVIKGKMMPLDICSVTQGDKRRFSFMSVAMGLMCDVDLGTEHLRWIGDTRFIYGFIKGIFFNSPMQCRLHVKVETADKGLMIQRLNDNRHARAKAKKTSNVPDFQNNDTCEDIADSEERSIVPPVRMLEPDESWLTLESGTEYSKAKGTLMDGKPRTYSGNSAWEKGEGILYIYTGLQPYVARDLLQFPVCLPGEGLMDVVVQSLVPRHVLAQSIGGASVGKQFYLDSQRYYKASAYVLEPAIEGGQISVDGEALQAKRTSVELIPKMARTLSLHGSWAESGFGTTKA